MTSLSLDSIPALHRTNWLYRFFLHRWIPFVLRFWTRVRVEGVEHLRVDGPFIVVSNHVANLDTYVLGVFVRDRVINYMGRTDGLHSRVLGWYWRKLGGIPADREGVARALEILKRGGAVGIFAEGRIAPSLVQPMRGSAVIALRSGAPVVPAAVWGTERVGILSILQPPRVTVRFGPPRVLRRRRGATSDAVMDDLMQEIATMLPERYRGVYAAADRPPNRQT